MPGSPPLCTTNRLLHVAAILCFGVTVLYGQSDAARSSRVQTWLPYQFIPNLTFHSSATGNAIGVEWEVAPVLYSWGINKKVTPWYSFIVVPTARFSGSVEWNVAVQLYSAKTGGSHAGASTHLIGYFPLSDVGELAGLDLGIGAYSSVDGPRFSKLVGISTAFGMLHFTLKHLDRPTAWVGSVEVRMY